MLLHFGLILPLRLPRPQWILGIVSLLSVSAVAVDRDLAKLNCKILEKLFSARSTQSAPVRRSLALENWVVDSQD
jgi:hypothetical protein